VLYFAWADVLPCILFNSNNSVTSAALVGVSTLLSVILICGSTLDISS